MLPKMRAKPNRILLSILFTAGLAVTGCDSEKVPKSPVNPSEPGAVQPGPDQPGAQKPGADQELGFAITSFDRCVAAGLPIMESHPRQCRYQDQVFVEELNPGTKGETKILYWRIAPTDSSCEGAQGPQRCLVTNGELFYDTIEGFTFKPGVETIVQVQRTQRCDPKLPNDCPQDIGIYTYKLLSIVNETPVNNDPNQPKPGEPTGHITFQGIITAIEPGKDGSTVELTGPADQKLYAVLSIPNLGPNSDFDFGAIKIGTKIEVEGEAFMLGDRRQMAAKKARVLP